MLRSKSEEPSNCLYYAIQYIPGPVPFISFGSSTFVCPRTLPCISINQLSSQATESTAQKNVLRQSSLSNHFNRSERSSPLALLTVFRKRPLWIPAWSLRTQVARKLRPGAVATVYVHRWYTQREWHICRAETIRRKFLWPPRAWLQKRRNKVGERFPTFRGISHRIGQHESVGNVGWWELTRKNKRNYYRGPGIIKFHRRATPIRDQRYPIF